MADKERPRKELWMFRERAPVQASEGVDFDPVDAIYHLRRNTRNPYLQRAIAPAADRGGRSDAELAQLARTMIRNGAYRAGPANAQEPLSRRSLPHPTPPAAGRQGYQEPAKLPGDFAKLPWLIHDFFQNVLGRLRSRPADFDLVVNDLLELFRENKIKVVLYEAYYGFRDWEHLMETLEEISQYPGPETFDLFCSALFTYYELVYPPEEG